MKRGLLVALAAAAVSVALAPTASAAIEVGTECMPSAIVSGGTVLPLQRAAGPLPLTVPAPGIVTRWRVSHDFEEPSMMRLKVGRETGVPGHYLISGESAGAIAPTGSSEFPTRVPVQAGDRMGLYAPTQVPLCTSSDGTNRFTALLGEEVVAGSTAAFSPSTGGFRLPVSATVEPDADGDGFGDETQDGCPRSADVHGACPPAPAGSLLSISSAGFARRGSALVLVATSDEARVRVAGSVTVRKPRKRRGKRGRASAELALSGGAKTMMPGQFGRFVLRFPRALRSQLAALPRRRSLSLRVTSTATSAGGQERSASLRIKLPGQRRARER